MDERVFVSYRSMGYGCGYSALRDGEAPYIAVSWISCAFVDGLVLGLKLKGYRWVAELDDTIRQLETWRDGLGVARRKQVIWQEGLGPVMEGSS